MDNKLILILASKMLDLAQNEFSNNGCNDLEESIRKLIPESMLEEMRQWNSKGTDPWPENTYQVGSSLMNFLSYKLEEMSIVVDRDIKIIEVLK